MDFRTVGVPRKKPLRQPEPGSRVAYYDEWGVGYARQSYGFGEYLEAYELPFADMHTLKEVQDYPWPSVADYDFSHLKEDCKAVGDYGSMLRARWDTRHHQRRQPGQRDGTGAD